MAASALLDSYSQTFVQRYLDWLLVALTGPTDQPQRVLPTYGFQNLNVSLINMSYYGSAAYLTDIYAEINTLRGQTEWDPHVLVPPVLEVLFTEAAKYVGYDSGDTSAYVRAVLWSLLHPNVANDPQNIGQLRCTVAQAAAQAVAGVNMSVIEANLTFRMGPTMWGAVPASSWWLALYQADVGYTLSPPPPPAPTPPLTAPPMPVVPVPPVTPPAAAPTILAGSSPSMSAGGMAAAIVVPILALVLLGLIAALFVWKRARAGYEVFGKVRAPGMGPATTMVITDIQSSTPLWECLHQDTMDLALEVHNALLRRLLRKHRGYETGTEGDSFLLAFHSPVDALAFSLEAQTALNHAAWPKELLEDPQAAAEAGEVYVSYPPSAFAWCEPSRATIGEVVRTSTRLMSLRHARSSGVAGVHATGLFRRFRTVFEPTNPNSAPETRAVSTRRSASSWGRAPSTFDEASLKTLPTMTRANYPPTFPAANAGGEPVYERASILQGDPQSERSSQAPRPSLGSGPSSNGSSTLAEALAREVQIVSPPPPPGGEGDEPPARATPSVRHSLRSSPQHQQSQLQQSQLQQSQLQQPPPPPPQPQQRVLAFRGLRVRMGLHSGPATASDWGPGCAAKSTSRYQASGAFLAFAKAVSDAGAGGMIVFSSSCSSALAPLQSGPPPGSVVLHLGAHRLKGQEGSGDLYLAMPLSLVCRLAIFRPMRTVALVSPSIMSAPMGCATVAFMEAAGVQWLQTFDPAIARDSLSIYYEVVTRSLLQWEGYLVKLVDGTCIAAFTDPGNAIAWALSCQQELLTQDWDPELLRHEFFEEVTVVVAPSPGAAPNPAAVDAARDLLLQSMAAVDHGPMASAASASAALEDACPLPLESHQPPALQLKSPPSAPLPGDLFGLCGEAEAAAHLCSGRAEAFSGINSTAPSAASMAAAPGSGVWREGSGYGGDAGGAGAAAAAAAAAGAGGGGVNGHGARREGSSFNGGGGGGGRTSSGRRSNDRAVVPGRVEVTLSERITLGGGAGGLHGAAAASTRSQSFTAGGHSSLVPPHVAVTIGYEETGGEEDDTEAEPTATGAIARTLDMRHRSQKQRHQQRAAQHHAAMCMNVRRLQSLLGRSLQVQTRVVRRGLRIKVGMDIGPVNTSVAPTTGRMEYRARAMNRAARICAHASSHQVLCSEDVWLSSQGTAHRLRGLPVLASSLGGHLMKGISQRMRLLELTLDADVMPHLARSSASTS